jgi:uncharacterized protein YecT (DUF1311 family)
MFQRLVGCAAIVLFLTSNFDLTPARAAEGPQPKDLRAVQACLKSHDRPRKREGCIGVVSDPCIGDEGSKSPADVIACLDRERLVWDQLLNAAYRKLRDNLDDEQRTKLREMQKSWVDTRDRTCAFYYDYFQGTMANPMIANCNNRETARRALFLIAFAEDLPNDEKGR